MSEVANPTPADAPSDDANLHDRVITVLKSCYDPEIPVDIYELGLIYDVAADEAAGTVVIKMTLTTPMCPVAEILPPEVEAKVRAMDGVSDATVEVTWEPPWNPAMMSEAARLDLNM